MNFNIELTQSPEISERSDEITAIEKLFVEYFNKRNYGNDVQNISLKLTIVNPPAGFEHLFRTLPPKFIHDKLVKNSYTNQMINFKNHFFCSVTIIGDDFLEFKSLPKAEFRECLIRKIVEGLMAIDKLPKKVKHFDKDRFKMDMKAFFSPSAQANPNKE